MLQHFVTPKSSHSYLKYVGIIIFKSPAKEVLEYKGFKSVIKMSLFFVT